MNEDAGRPLRAKGRGATGPFSRQSLSRWVTGTAHPSGVFLRIGGLSHIFAQFLIRPVVRLVGPFLTRNLMGLFLLGVIAGVILDLSGKLLRVWGKDVGLLPVQMDRLSLLDGLGSLRVFWAPLLMLPLQLCWGRNKREAHYGALQGRRAWVIVCLMGTALAVWALGSVPFLSPMFQVVLAALIVLFNSLDVLVIASQADAATQSLWGISEGVCLNGYRVGLMVSSAVALSLSHRGVSWSTIYGGMAWVIVGVAVLVWRLPLFAFLTPKSTAQKVETPDEMMQASLDVVASGASGAPAQAVQAPRSQTHAQDVGAIPGQFWRALWGPAWAWFHLPGSLWMVAVMVTFRWQDSLIDPQREYVMLAAGLTKANLAGYKTLAVWASVMGGLGAGGLIGKRGHGWTLQTSLALHGALALVLALLVGIQAGPTALAAGLLLENVTKSMALVAFYAFQMVCCQPGKVVAQLALVAALGDLGYHGLAMRSGFVAQHWGWTALFVVAALANVPGFFSVRRALATPFVRQNLVRRPGSEHDPAGSIGPAA